MQGEAIGVNRELLTSYVEEQLHGLDGDARRRRLDEIRADFQQNIDSGFFATPDDVLVARQFLADLDVELPTVPISTVPSQPKSNARAVRHGAMMLMPRASLLIFSLLGAARTGNARNAVVGVIAVALVLIARSAYVSIKATSA